MIKRTSVNAGALPRDGYEIQIVVVFRAVCVCVCVRVATLLLSLRLQGELSINEKTKQSNKCSNMNCCV